MRNARLLLPSLAILLAISCATASQSGERRTGSQNQLSHEELVNTSELTLYDAIQRLRPMWLRARGNSATQGPDPVIVYMNNVRVGDISYLHDIMVESVEEVSFVNASDATTRGGIGGAGGVILVVSRPG